MASVNVRRRTVNPDEARLVHAWGRLGNEHELTRICRDILTRPRQGYAVALAAQNIIQAHVDYWRLDFPIEADASRKNRLLLKTGPQVVRRLDRALLDMVNLHRAAQQRKHWYGKRIVDGQISDRSPRKPWKSFPELYEQMRKTLDIDPLWQTLRDTPSELWSIPPRGNPVKRRNGSLAKALRGAGLTKLQIDDVIHGLGWTAR